MKVKPLILPAWEFTHRQPDQPNRHRLIATHTSPARPGKAAVRFDVVTNWPRTVYWAYAVFVGGSRASNTLRTTSAKKGEWWAEQVRAGNVTIPRADDWDGWSAYGDIPYRKLGAQTIYLWRKGQRCRWRSLGSGLQVGPEQRNVAPAIAWALASGYRA